MYNIENLLMLSLVIFLLIVPFSLLSRVLTNNKATSSALPRTLSPTVLFSFSYVYIYYIGCIYIYVCMYVCTSKYVHMHASTCQIIIFYTNTGRWMEVSTLCLGAMCLCVGTVMSQPFYVD